MEKVSKVVEHNNGLVELFKDFWVDIVSSFKHDIYQTIIQLLGFFSSIFLMLQDSLAYNKYLKLDDAFLQHIMPCIVGSAAYAFFFYKKDDLGHNKFMTFLLSVSVSAYSIEGILRILNWESTTLWFTLGGFLMFPSLQIISYAALSIKKEVPKIVGIATTFLSNKFGSSKKDSDTDS
jgi:hypothetical protein